MNNENQQPVFASGEILFRVCAYGLTGLQCMLYVLILTLLFCAVFFVFGATIPEGTTIYSSETGLSINGIIGIVLLICFLLIPNLLGWFITFLYPLKSKSQTWGMKMFGLKAVASEGNKLSWKTVLLQEGVQALACALFVGLLGLVMALFKDDGKTFFNRISGTSIIQEQARLKFVKEFREYRSKNL